MVRGVNDNIEELKKYIDLMKAIGIKTSELMIDQCDNEFLQNGEFIIPKYYYDLFDFYKNYCIENNIEPHIWEYIKEILDKGLFFK